MAVRFFGGWDFADNDAVSPDFVDAGYTKGVPMGGELTTGGTAPTFIVWASGDPAGARLQRMQVIKGYIKDGEAMERVYDVACSDKLTPDPHSHRCPDNGARVNLADCSVTADVGDGEMLALWQDPDYDADVDAFYYTRVLENPSCRWSTWDALRAGVAPRADLPTTIQERAWSSPIFVDQPRSPVAEPAANPAQGDAGEALDEL